MTKKMLAGIIGLAILIGVLLSLRSAFEFVEADEICIIQDPVDGDLHMYVEPGLYWQNFGTVTKYEKEFQYTFLIGGEDETDQSIKCRFNDGGHANISGSVRIKMPLTYEMMTRLHKLFNSQIAIEKQLIRPLIEKSVYMTGPIMSSKESYADKRNDLLYYIEDQIVNGVYKTTSKDVKEPDAITGELKTVKVVEIAQDTLGMPYRNEKSPLSLYSITVYNLSINEVKYDGTVEKQITEQQKIAMDVQTSIADAKKAEQNAIKIAKQGEANAAEAKWKQEVIKAQAITEAEQKAKVAEWAMKEADYYKQTQVLRAQADAEYKRAVMYADGGLTQKLATYEKVMAKYCDMIATYKGNWVPSIIAGGTGSGSGASGAEALFQAMSVKTLRDLSLDMSVPGNTGKK
jgi:hypothetical protein